ncbi:MAG TPA: glycogen/starch/alpha-glucan phosphorylase [Planctomycetota bacterium]|nr:glycogen/starch/alpha-glucan phosphorylase [Planctomycetota bacterium]
MDFQERIENIQKSFLTYLKVSQAKDGYSANAHHCYAALAMVIQEQIIDKWLQTQRTYHIQKVKRVYYLSMEFLPGRLFTNNLINLGILDEVRQAIETFNPKKYKLDGFELKLNWDDIYNLEEDPALGNGGLGRLASCFLDSMTTCNYPAIGYGLRFRYGIFRQGIENGQQTIHGDEWLKTPYAWEIPQHGYTIPVPLGGKAYQQTQQDGKLKWVWEPDDYVLGMPYDIPVTGYGTNNVNTLRLWQAMADEEFDLNKFNDCFYTSALQRKLEAEKITQILYPNDKHLAGKQLRFLQQYFLVRCTIFDIIRRFEANYQKNYDLFPEKVAIQLNDTHPVLAIPELMRILLDEKNFSWEYSWDIVSRTFGYTNHTIMPEALEKWSVDFFHQYLPRHLHIIYEINSHLMSDISIYSPGNNELLEQMSLVEEYPEKRIRMAHLATVASHTVNGVSKLHSEILKQRILKQFYNVYPEKFQNKTNGITPRRWLMIANPELTQLITESIGSEWPTNLEQLEKLENFIQDSSFREKFYNIKHNNKVKLAKFIKETQGIDINPYAIFDVHAKRIHEYKRQLLNLMHIITLYIRIKNNPNENIHPQVFIFAGKAAPGYDIACLIIRFIHGVANIINQDPDIKDKLKVIFIPNYKVTYAQCIIPGTDISEQISTAGMEASGTGNMKFALNGALTIATLDGANLEMMEHIGQENMFPFGMTADDVYAITQHYDPREFYDNCPLLQQAITLIRSNYFSMYDPHLFNPLIDALFRFNEPYYILGDFQAYSDAQSIIQRTYTNKESWITKSIYNVARVGYFSADRAIEEYAKDIWKIQKVFQK